MNAALPTSMPVRRHCRNSTCGDAARSRSLARRAIPGCRGFTTRDSGRPGPHVVLVSLTHGNELAGAIVLDRLLRAGLRPLRGRLTFGFANLAAFARFDRDRSHRLPLRR